MCQRRVSCYRAEGLLAACLSWTRGRNGPLRGACCVPRSVNDVRRQMLMRPLTDSARDRWASLQRDLGQRLAKRLFDEVLSDPVSTKDARRTRLTWSLTLAYLIAAAVHMLSAAFGVFGVMLLAGAWSNLFVVLAGATLIVLCIVSRPRLAQVPHCLVNRAEYPVLYRLSDLIAESMGAEMVDGIAVSPDFSANYRVAGWRRRRYVELGTPLLAILTPSERVAVIAHELSHGANGDPLRSQFLFGAVSTVATWGTTIRPISIGRLGEGMPFGPFVSILAIPFEFLTLAASELLFLTAKGFLLLVLRESQRAEYLADLLAAKVAGSAEMQHALEKTYLFDVVDAAIRTHALTTPDEGIGNRLSDAVSELSGADLDQHRQASWTLSWQVDSTHPPTALRVEMLAARAPQESSPLLSPADLAALNSEVDRLVASTQSELVNRKLEAIYG